MKRVAGVGITVCLLILQMLTVVYGKDAIPQVNLTKDGYIKYEQSESKEIDGKNYFALGNIFEEMAPGDTKTQQIHVSNHWNKQAAFYISMGTLQTMEDMSKASGGAYKVKLSVKNQQGNESVILDTTAGGYRSDGSVAKQSDASVTGLKDIKELEDFYAFANLKSDESADLYLSISLEGEGMDNSYQQKEAVLAMDFCAFSEEDDKIITTSKTETPANTVTTSNIIKAVKTNDNSRALLWGAVLVVGILCVATAFYKKRGGRKHEKME